jgi:hypothetical protein
MEKNKIHLIGINGRAGSGKDLVTSIIQYLTQLKNIDPAIDKDGYWSNMSFEDFQKDKHLTMFSEWKNKKFAEPLKKIVCIITGCTMKQLEDQEFKKTLVPFSCYKLNYATEFGLFNKLFLSTKEAQEYVDSLEEVYYPTVDKFHMTYRQFLQIVGTDLFRDLTHPQIWCLARFANYEEGDDWVLSDMRFINEADAIKSRGGITIRINRLFKSPLDLGSLHESETALDNYQFDEIIENTGSKEELIEKVKQLLIKYNIL